MAESQLINTIPEGKTKVYHASCGDENREITVSLHDGPALYTLDGTEALTLRYKKVNGEIRQCTGTLYNSLVKSMTVGGHTPKKVFGQFAYIEIFSDGRCEWRSFREENFIGTIEN